METDDLAGMLAAVEQRLGARRRAMREFARMDRLLDAIPDVLVVGALPARVRHAGGEGLCAKAVGELGALRVLARESKREGRERAHGLVADARTHYAETQRGVAKRYGALLAGLEEEYKGSREELETLETRRRALKRRLRHGDRDKTRAAFREYRAQLRVCLARALVDQPERYRTLAAADVPAMVARLDALERDTAAALREALGVACANTVDRVAQLAEQASAAVCAETAVPVVAGAGQRPSRRARAAARRADPGWQRARVDGAVLGSETEARLRDLGVVEQPAHARRARSAE